MTLHKINDLGRGSTVTEPEGQLFQLTITATGEVRDSDGNLISQEPVEATKVLTADEAREFTERFQP